MCSVFNVLQGGPAVVGNIHVQNGSTLEDFGILWPDGDIPSDGSPRSAQLYPYLWLVVTSNLFACVTIVLAVICLVFTFIFRNKK